MKDKLNLPVDGETALATPIGDDLALISGVADTMPDTIEVLLNGDPSMTMKAGVVSWQRKNAPADAATGFVAVVPIRLAAKVRLRSIVVRRNGPPIRYDLVRPAASVQDLMEILFVDTAERFTDVTDGITQTLIEGQGNAKRLAAALSVLTAAAKNDGWIEVMGPLDTGELLLQGWAHTLPSDELRVLVAQDGLLVGEVKAASVQRDDLGGNGVGFIGLLDTGPVSVEPESLQRIFFRTKDGWRTLDVYEKRVLLPTTDVPAHIRDGLARASAHPDTMQVLRRAGERFDGRDTVSSLQQPVRIGMDMVAEVPGGGLLVAGWMLDPEGHADTILLRAGSDFARIDDAWTRLPRPDVSAAFQHNELFAGRLDPRRLDHGFLAFVPGLSCAGDTPVYFELMVGDSVAFYPLKPMRNLSRQGLERLVSPLDPRTAAAGAAIDLHIGPMMQALAAPAPRVVETRDFGFDGSGAPKALVVGAGHDVEELSAALVLLALDAEARNTPMIVSAPIEAFGSLAPEAERLARFYGLRLRIIGSEEVQDACDAFEAAIQATDAEALVLLAASVLPRQSGWLSSLERAYRKRGGKALVSPTIVYEDDSIRFAGTWFDADEQKLVDRYIGYPRDVVHGSEPAEVMAGSTACCMVARSAIEAAGGFTRSYLGTSDKGRDLCLKMRLCGTMSVWTPDVEMISAEDDAGATGPAIRRLAQRIDRWSFDRKWSLLVNNMR
ncbi:glycosyltransferase family 2 protein [Microvirga sp. M2]|uniref:glycosyltransferase family 2 protein n=1 Tax=Microvirga sp. M2 TaxID=3073270 RepID=UPI0039C296AD